MFAIAVLGNLKIRPTGVDDTFEDTTLEDEEAELDGEEKTAFLAFIRRMLRWLPEGRLPVRELLEDPWLRAGLARIELH